MICPSCGLLNTPLAENCAGCQGPLPSRSEGKLIDLNKALKNTGAVGRDAASISSVSDFPKSADPQKAQEKQSKVHEVKEESMETLVKDFLDRDFVKTDPTRSGPSTATARSQESPPAKRTLQKPEASDVQDRVPSSTPESPQVQRAGRLGVAVAKKRQGSLFSEKIQRIEIDLNQSTLPFRESKSPASSWTDPLRRDLQSAMVRDRFGAGIVDALFIVGCWLIFGLVVAFATPDFQFFSSSAGLGFGVVFLTITLCYLFLFIVLGARTLGMGYMGLAVVRFDGKVPSARDVGLRTVGYCISTGCFGLGFLWSLFDPERLTWHDRISKTLVIEANFSDPRQS